MTDPIEPKRDDAPFLTRWAQRKQTAQRAPQSGAETKKAADDAPPPDGRADAEAADGEPEFDPATLPNVEDLTAESDITAFLSKGVPEELKRLALRRVWALDPQIRDFVEVAENQYDWNAVNGVPGFGALPEGTDIQALLAQATGQIQQIVAAAETATPAIRSPTEPPLALSQLPEDKADIATGRSDVLTTNPAEASADQGTETSPKQGYEPAVRSARRRHGGALPA